MTRQKLKSEFVMAARAYLAPYNVKGRNAAAAELARKLQDAADEWIEGFEEASFTPATV